jgi:hypothetical protein
MTGFPNQQLPDQQWRAMRLLRLLYVRLAREFALNAPPCDELDTGIEVPSQDDVDVAQKWFQEMDEKIQVFQLRQFLQTTTGVNEETIVGLIQHHIGKGGRTEADRDKVDFLIVQLLTQTSPARIEENAVDLPFVANGLEPVLGQVDPVAPDWLSPLEDLIEKAKACDRLDAIFGSGILEDGRKIKAAAGQNYFQPEALVAFARFNFLLRRVFFRLMQADIAAILDGLRDLELRGIQTLDCTSVQFSDQESILQLRMVCQSWKIMFQAEYALGQPMKILADLRRIVDQALNATPAAETADSGLQAKAASASANGSSNGASDVPEFEVSSGSPPES